MNRRDVLCGCAACAVSMGAAQAFAARLPARYRDVQPDILPHYRPELSSVEAGLWMSMDQAEEEIKASHYVMRDPDLQAYLEEILCRLGGEYCRDVRVYPLRIPYFNASMAPNGMMMVWSGLLLRVSNEHQLAAVLGHEMGHYLRRHSLKFWNNAKRTANFAAFLGLGMAAAGAATGTYLGGDIAQIAVLSSIFKFSRDNEREADAYGLELMARANYNPWQAPVIWERLIAEEHAAKYKRNVDPFFASHPQEEERIANLRGHASDLGMPQTADIGDNARFLEVIGKHRADLVGDQLNLRQFGQTELVLKSLLDDNFRVGETRYYLGENHRLRGEAGDREKAKEYYLAALGGEAEPPELHRALGMVYLKESNAEAARASFGRYLELKPEADDREMIQSYMGGWQ